MPDPPLVGARHVVPCAAVLLVTLLCGGCGGAVKASPAPAPPPAPAALDGIADALGCRAEVTVEAEELREGACAVGPQAYRMATFGTADGRRAWLAESRQYGGTYLVGDLWVVTAPSEAALTPVRDRLGGSLETGSAHGSHASHASSEPAAPDHGSHGSHGSHATPGDPGPSAAVTDPAGAR